MLLSIEPLVKDKDIHRILNVLAIVLKKQFKALCEEFNEPYIRSGISTYTTDAFSKSNSHIRAQKKLFFIFF